MRAAIFVAPAETFEGNHMIGHVLQWSVDVERQLDLRKKDDDFVRLMRRIHS